MIERKEYAWLANVSNNAPLFFILGPCVIENENDTLQAAYALKKISEKLGFKLIFKGSIDKANRTSMTGFRGVELDHGLKILQRVRQEFDVPVLTDVHETCQVDTVASVVDVLQIPAFLCRQTDLICQAAKTGKIVNIKKGQFEAPESMEHALGKVAATGNDNAWLCERGYSFGYHNLIVDMRNFSIMKRLGKPIVFDVTHSVQRPGGLGAASGGDIDFIPTLAAAAICQKIAGLFLMVHAQPDKALCCGPVSIPLDKVERLLAYFVELDAWIKQRPDAECLLGKDESAVCGCCECEK